jgi:hypothetical protein
MDQPPSNMHHNDNECGQTASTSNGSDPETIVTDEDTMMQRVVSPLNRKDADVGKIMVDISAIDNVEFCKAEEHNAAKLDLDRLVIDDTWPLSEATSKEHTSNKKQEQQQKSSKELTQNLSSHEMLSHIEARIKAAIQHNTQVHTNSIELESVLRRQSVSGGCVPLELNMSLPLDSLEADLDLPTVSLDDVSTSSRHSLQQQIDYLKLELKQVKKAKDIDELQHNATVNQLRKELRSANKLIRKLQTKKLVDMETKFISSLELLEAKLSNEINEGDTVEDQLTVLRQERDTARELNLPLFNDLKKLYEIKSGLEGRVEELEMIVEEQMGIAEGLAHKIQELEKVQIEKDATASETASKLSNEVLFAHEEITRLQSEMESMAEEKDGQIEELTTRLLELGQGTTPSTIQQLRLKNAHLSTVNKQLEASNLTHQEICTRLQSEEQDLRWKLEATKANMELQLKVRDERILELESKRG